MAIKYSIQGLLIYAAMAAYLLALAGWLFGLRRAAKGLFFAAFVISAGSFVYRWFHTGHVPLQNLFELFIAMGMVVYVLSLFCRMYIGVDQSGIDMLLGIIVLFPAGFVFSEAPQQLPPALQSPFFVPHVAAYLFAYIFMFKAAVTATGVFLTKPGRLEYEGFTYRLICAGFPLLSLGLVLGSMWAHYAWADYWGWDPKEMWSLTAWLIYAGYFHFRFMVGRKYSRLNSLWVLAGFAAILITLLWANLSRLFEGLHSYAV